MAAYYASPIFQICIFQSPRLQMRDLWLRLKKVPLIWWLWQKFDEYGVAIEGEFYEHVELTPRASTMTTGIEYKCKLAPVQPTTLCPIVHLWDLEEERLPGGFTEEDAPPPRCTVGIIATPSELELYGDMIFTDPPVYEACSRLFYRHNRIWQCYITGERTVKSDVPLTVRGFIDAAFRMRGDISIHDKDREDAITGIVLHRMSLEEVILERIRQLGGHFDLEFNRSPVCFKGISVLRSDE